VMFAKELSVPIIGVIENMSGLTCPNCGARIDVFRTGGGEKIAEELDADFLGKIPLDPRICEASDEGSPFVISRVESPAAEEFMKIMRKIEAFLAKNDVQTRGVQRNRGKHKNNASDAELGGG